MVAAAHRAAASAASPRCGCSTGRSCRGSAGRCSSIALLCQAGRLLGHRLARAPVEHPRDRRARHAAACGAGRTAGRGCGIRTTVIVAIEGIALPLVHTAWITALVLHGAERDPAARLPHPGRGARARGGARPDRGGRCDRRRAARRRRRPGRARRRDRGAARRASTSLVVEPRGGVIDKACGEGLMPGAVTRSTASGVHPRGIRTDRRHRLPRRTPLACSIASPTGPASGVRRTTLHAALRARADELGVRWVAATGGRASDRDAGVVVTATPGTTARRLAARRRRAALDGRALGRAGAARAAAAAPLRAAPALPRRRRGPTWSRCTGRRPASSTSPRSPTAWSGVALLARRGVHFDEALARLRRARRAAARAPSR